MKNALSLVCILLSGILMSTTSFAQSNTLFNPDYNGDGFIGVDDILGALSFYDNVWDGPVANVIYGCTYPLFAEYDASANVDDGSCATLAVLGCTDSSYLEYDASANVDDGSCLTTHCYVGVTYQGYDYATVLIGEQCWFAENLRNENYKNGDAIPTDLSYSEWQSTDSGATADYIQAGYGSESIVTNFGHLYNWHAVNDARGLCPSGWHVPTDGEWTILTDHLGGESVAGGQMKANYGWFNGGNGTNSSGFSGLPGGTKSADGPWNYVGMTGYWWCSSPNGSNAWLRSLSFHNEDVWRTNLNQSYGFSVRCVRDAE